MRTGRLRWRLDALELYTEKELTVERDAGAGGLPHVWDGRWRRSVRARAALWVSGRACEPSLSHISLGVFVAFVMFCDICHFRRAGMSYRVNAYSLSGAGSIDWVPGVVSAAWGGLWCARRTVRAAPKTRNYGPTRV